MERIFLISAALGVLLSLALLSHIFRSEKANFFLGLITLVISLELLFSWGAQSGYNNHPGAFPFWIFLSYYLIPIGILLFTKATLDAREVFVRRNSWLFLPVGIEIVWQASAWFAWVPNPTEVVDSTIWWWLTDYLPLAALLLVLIYFWYKYVLAYRQNNFPKSGAIPHLKLLLLMSVLSLLALFWLVFSFTGWTRFEWIEMLLVFFIFSISFLILMDGQSFPIAQLKQKNGAFASYNDEEQLRYLKEKMEREQLFRDPELSLKSLAETLELPARYVSYLINTYHRKNFKEYLNAFRVYAFIQKAQSREIEQKTILALAFEAGFNSKSTFNQVFKQNTGKSPSQYLAQ